MSFQKGISGNPAGRPPGIPDKRAASVKTQLRELIAPHAPELIELALAQARAGDPVAIRLLLDRVIPPVKPASEPAGYDVAEGASIAEHGRAIMTATAGGHITADQALALLGTLERLAKLIKATDKKVQVGTTTPDKDDPFADPFERPTAILAFNYSLAAPSKETEQ